MAKGKDPFMEPKPDYIGSSHKEPDDDQVGGMPDNDSDDKKQGKRMAAKLIKARLMKMRKNAAS